MSGKLVTRLDLIKRYAERDAGKNMRFRSFVKTKLKMPDTELDTLVAETAGRVGESIPCTSCGNCCRTLMISVDNDDIARLAKRVGMSFRQFTKRYVLHDGLGEKALSSPPCPFLEGNLCTVYEDRPKACRDFPYLHETGFRGRMLAAIENAAVCPIVFNTLEQVKERLDYEPKGGR